VDISSLLKEYDEKLDSLERILNYRFNDKHLLFRALCHSSFTNEHGLPGQFSNERLEFLGDSVIELAVSNFLYSEYPDYTEGDLTKARALLVSRRSLAQIASSAGMGNFVLLGKGERISGGRRKQSILAGAFEALIGAVFLDSGFETAQDMVISFMRESLKKLSLRGLGDFKSELQEFAVKEFKCAPEYSVKYKGPAHSRTFYAKVSIAGFVFGPVEGSSRKEAEQGAARAALLELKHAIRKAGHGGEKRLRGGS